MAATVRGISVGNRTGSLAWDGTTEYTVTYYVTTDSVDDGPAAVRTAFGIPAIGDAYALGNEVDTRAVATQKTVRERESPTEWEVDVTFSSMQQDAPENEEEDPVFEPAEISMDFQVRQKVIPGFFQDPASPNVLGNLARGIVSSNGELFDPQPEYEIGDPVLTIKKNLPEMDATWLMSIANTVNIASFYGADPRQLRLMPPATQRAWDKVRGFYWPTTFQFLYRYETWDVQILNRGTFYMEGGSTKKFFKDSKDGTPYIGLLKENGDALNTSSDEDRGRWVEGGDDETFTRLRVYREIDFNFLGII